jgi:hypothetical protein
MSSCHIENDVCKIEIVIKKSTEDCDFRSFLEASLQNMLYLLDMSFCVIITEEGRETK